MQYRGKNFAYQCWKLWEERSHIVRIVDTCKLRDADNLERSITFDVDNLRLREHQEIFSVFYGEVAQTTPSLDGAAQLTESPALFRQLVSKIANNTNQNSPNTFILPFLLLRKHPLVDVDAKGRGNVPMHLCRRSVNIEISGHIIVGLCLSLGFVGNQGDLYEKAISFLGNKRPPSGSMKMSAREDLTNTAEEFGVYRADSRYKLKNFLDLLTVHYIQCLEYPYVDASSDPTTIIKIRVSDSLKLLTNASRSMDNYQYYQRLGGHGYLSRDQKSGREAIINETKSKYDEFNQKPFRSKARKFGEFIGVLSTTIVIPLQLGSTKVRPSRHEIFIAPAGTQIGGAFLVRESDRDSESDEDQFEQRNATIATHTSERASLLIRDQTKKGYSIQVKLNPTLSALIIPAIFVCVLQLAISSIALFEGPNVVSKNAIAFTGTAVVAPFVTVVFIAKDSEHDMVSRLLSFPRMLLAVSSAILVISGAFISVLPKKEATFRCAIDKPLEAFCRPTNEKTSFLASHLLSFVGLSLVSLIAIFTVLLLSRIIWRTARGSLGLHRRAQDALDLVELDFDGDRVEKIRKRCKRRTNSWNIVGFSLIIVGIVAAGAWSIFVWRPAVSSWWPELSVRLSSIKEYLLHKFIC